MSEHTITEFLEARIAEDEQLARDAIADDMGQDGGFEDAFDRLTKLVPGGFLPRFGEAAARMIVWNAPRRVLAECAAKRAIIGLHVPVDYSGIGMTSPNACSICGAERSMSDWEWVLDSFPCDTLRALAAVYADHADYRQEWAL